MTIPYGSKPEPKKSNKDIDTLRELVEFQRFHLDIARRDVTDLKSLASSLNTKLRNEMKRSRVLQEEVVLANANIRNVIMQNEDLRQTINHIKAHGIEKRHIHTVKNEPSSIESAIAMVGIAAIAGMFIFMVFAVLSTL